MTVEEITNRLTKWDDGSKERKAIAPTHLVIDDIHTNDIIDDKKGKYVYTYTSYRVVYHADRTTKETKETGIKDKYLGYLVPGQVVPCWTRKPAGKGRNPEYANVAEISMFAWTALASDGLLILSETDRDGQKFDPGFYVRGAEDEVQRMLREVGEDKVLVRPMGKYRHVLGEDFVHGMPFKVCQDEDRAWSHRLWSPEEWTDLHKDAHVPQTLSVAPNPTLRLVHMLNDAENKERNAQLRKDPRHSAFRGEQIHTLWNPIRQCAEHCRILDIPVGLLPAEQILDNEEEARDIIRSATYTYLRGRKGVAKDASLAWPSRIGFAWIDDPQFPYSKYPNVPKDWDKTFWTGPEPQLEKGESLPPQLAHVTWTGYPPAKVAYRAMYRKADNTAKMITHLQLGMHKTIRRYASGSYDFGAIGGE